MKVISCGFIIHDDSQFLVGHVTGQGADTWSIPKGRIESGESFLDCAIRELHEETSIDLSDSPYGIKPMGLFEYIPKKDLYLFSYKCDLKSLPELKCTSMIEKEGMRDLPEFDWFQFIPFDQAKTFVHKKIAEIIEDIFIRKLCYDD